MVYVYGWGGIGRTRTVIGCHFVRHGHPGDETLAALVAMWKVVDKHQRRPQSPETRRRSVGCGSGWRVMG